MSGPQIFVSYAVEDAELASELAKLFRTAGYDVWVDRSHLDAGTRLAPEIERAIRTSDLFVPLFTADYARKFEAGTYVRREAELALSILDARRDAGTFVIPIDAGGGVPDPFRKRDLVPCMWSSAAEKERLLSSVFHALERLGRAGIEITVASGPDEGCVVRKALTVIGIGRGEGNDVRLRDPSVSASHAQVTIRRHSVMLLDTSGSETILTSPTREERLRRTSARLFHGDLVLIGETTLRFAFDGIDLGRLIATTTKKRQST